LGVRVRKTRVNIERKIVENKLLTPSTYLYEKAFMKRGRKKNDKRHHIARELKIEGFTYAEIGHYMGVSRQRIQQMLKDVPEIPAQRCSKCGKPSKVLHYHHPHYQTKVTKPLCASCHSKLHWKSHKLNFMTSQERAARPDRR
jgi:hypothetical protein